MPKSKQRKKALKAKNIQAKRMAKWRRENGDALRVRQEDGSVLTVPSLSPHYGDEALFASVSVPRGTKVTPELARAMKTFVDEMEAASEDADRAADIAENGPRPISPELEQKIEGILHAVRKDKPLSQVQQAARDAGLELHVKIEKAPIVADVVADQVTDNTEAVQAAVDEAAMSGAFNRAVLATKTKSDLLILAANRDVNVFKSWTNERIIDAIMASA
jgi:hypothetical protein